MKGKRSESFCRFEIVTLIFLKRISSWNVLLRNRQKQQDMRTLLAFVFGSHGWSVAISPYTLAPTYKYGLLIK